MTAAKNNEPPDIAPAVLSAVTGITKQYGQTKALQGVDWELPVGRIIGLLGPNSSGKTTLMKVIAGVAQPDRGRIIYPGGVKAGIAAKRKIAFLPDTSVFPGWMRVKDAYEYYRAAYGDFNREREDYLRKLLELDSCWKERIKKLSKGMQERCVIGLALAREVDLYLLDEPLGGIDPVEKNKIMDAIISMKPEQATIVIATHLVKDVERILDSICLLREGRIIYREDCESIRQKYRQTVEQRYMEVLINDERN